MRGISNGPDGPRVGCGYLRLVGEADFPFRVTDALGDPAVKLLPGRLWLQVAPP